MNYYNENDPYCVQWLKNLITAGHIPQGEVDARSIKEVSPGDLGGFTQCHFFAGIAGWPLALKLAGWPEDREVWTGSCPCQPFSVAGKQKGFSDDRHLWPEFHRLISERHPSVVFGEQVAAASQWLAGVRSDLEALDYAMGCRPIQAACAGAPQYRDRLWFVADNTSERSDRRSDLQGTDRRSVPKTSCTGLLAPELCQGLEERQSQQGDDGSEQPTHQRNGLLSVERPSLDGCGEEWTESEFRSRGFTATVANLSDGSQFIECPDGKFRRLPPPRVRWLGNGIPPRVAKLRAYGNAIVPQVAAQFIRAYFDCRP